MLRIRPATQGYAWGSSTFIPDLIGAPATGEPVAELWIGAHGSAPAMVVGAQAGDGPTPPGDRIGLDALLAADPAPMLGEGVRARFGDRLPYLLKVIAADRPLSLQVHPSLTAARAGFAREEAQGVPLDAPHRSYRDVNHKPELVYALTPFRAMCGFRAPRRAAELMEGLDAPLAKTLRDDLRDDPSSTGVRRAFERLLQPSTRPGPEDVADVVEACRQRLEHGSPSPRADRTVVALAEQYPGDPGIVTSLLLNPVSLEPGEAMFVPAGCVHAYLSGAAVEVMASSDNVLRAGLTPKHVDIPELLANVDCVAAPPIRIAPERFHGATGVFYAPVDDFELSVTTLVDDAEHPLPGRGPRALLCLDGTVAVRSAAGASLELSRGQAAFVPAADGALWLRGRGRVVQADVP